MKYKTKIYLKCILYTLIILGLFLLFPQDCMAQTVTEIPEHIDTDSGLRVQSDSLGIKLDGTSLEYSTSGIKVKDSYVAGVAHSHTGSTLSGIDISDDTNLSAGDALSLDGDAIDFDGGALPAGDLSGSSAWSNPQVVNDSHYHTGTTISGLDISSDTNLSAGDALTLNGDEIDFDGGATPSGDLSGSWASPQVVNNSHDHTTSISGKAANVSDADFGDVTVSSGSWAVEDNSHSHTGSSISGLDISSDTNLTAGDFITLNNDDLDVDAKDEDNMSSNSATHLATQQSIKAYVDRLGPNITGDDNYFTIIASGQSNMVGGAWGSLDFATDSRVKVWNILANAWVLADITDTTDTGKLHANFPAPEQNIAFHFAKQVAEDYNVNVRLIFEAVSSTSITSWVGSGTSSARYAAITTQITNSSTSEVDCFLWHQGEADAGMNNATYGANLKKLLTQLYTESEIDSTRMRFIAGELGSSDTYNAQNAVYYNIAHYVPYPQVAVARLNDLPTSDGVHFVAQAKVGAGRNRYYAAWKAQAPTHLSVEAIQGDVSYAANHIRMGTYMLECNSDAPDSINVYDQGLYWGEYNVTPLNQSAETIGKGVTSASGFFELSADGYDLFINVRDSVIAVIGYQIKLLALETASTFRDEPFYLEAIPAETYERGDRIRVRIRNQMPDRILSVGPIVAEPPLQWTSALGVFETYTSSLEFDMIVFSLTYITFE